MPRTFADVPVSQYRARWKDLDKYERVDTVPDDLKWRPVTSPGDARFTVLCTIGDYYRLVRDRDTGAVVYYKRKDAGRAMSPKAQIDSEPKKRDVRYRVGAHCWFVDSDARWYAVTVVAREPNRMTIRPVTGWDAERIKAWSYGNDLEFPAKSNNPLYQRLRPLKARAR